MEPRNHVYVPSRHILKTIFDGIDTNFSGSISKHGLQSALSNGTWKPFNIQTVDLMIGMFDRDGSGTIDFDEFVALWSYITDWQNTFHSLDRDNSGGLDRKEMRAAMFKFGYIISEEVLNLIMRKYDRLTRGTVYFDEFIQCCVTIQNVAKVFKELDTESDGWVKIHFETFLNVAFESSL